jgi:hypothetical protein
MYIKHHLFQARPVWIYSTLRVTSQTSYSPEYTTPTQKKKYYKMVYESMVFSIGKVLFYKINHSAIAK